MCRLAQFCGSAILLIAATIPTSGQGSNDVTALLGRNQFDLAADGREFLRTQVSRASFLLVGGLHGDTETQALFQSIMPSFGDGPTLVVTEMSPLAASRIGPMLHAC